MPLFFFDICNGAREMDEVGVELASLDDARSQAVKLVGEMLRFDGRSVLDGHGLLLELLDEARRPLFTVKVSADTPFPAS